MDSSQLEDWFTDIESTTDLTDTCHTKLAQAKSKGLTCTLISEALSSDKSWDGIKDLLRLKLCNWDIHRSISHLWKYSKKIKNHWQPTFTDSREKQNDATFTVIQPQSDCF